MKFYTKKLKLTACKAVMLKNQAPKEVAKKYDINLSTLYHWVQDYKINNELAFIKNSELSDKERALKLVRICYSKYPKSEATVMFIENAIEYLERKSTITCKIRKVS